MDLAQNTVVDLTMDMADYHMDYSHRERFDSGMPTRLNQLMDVVQYARGECSDMEIVRHQNRCLGVPESLDMAGGAQMGGRMDRILDRH